MVECKDSIPAYGHPSRCYPTQCRVTSLMRPVKLLRGYAATYATTTTTAATVAASATSTVVVVRRLVWSGDITSVIAACSHHLVSLSVHAISSLLLHSRDTLLLCIQYVCYAAASNTLLLLLAQVVPMLPLQYCYQ